MYIRTLKDTTPRIGRRAWNSEVLPIHPGEARRRHAHHHSVPNRGLVLGGQVLANLRPSLGPGLRRMRLVSSPHGREIEPVGAFLTLTRRHAHKDSEGIDPTTTPGALWIRRPAGRRL
jgi:hypothetical protein